MKTILYIVAVVTAFAASFFSFSHSRKFDALQKTSDGSIATKVITESKKADADIADEKKQLADAKEKQELLNQSVSSLKSAGIALNADLAKLKTEEATQNEDFAQLDNALAEVNTTLAGLGGGVTLDTLPEKIQEIEADKAAKQKKLEELEALVAGADKSLATNRAEMERLSKRTAERNARIAGNSIEAVVTAVNRDWGFLLIGAGSNSGFTPQTTLLVERDGRKIASVRPSAIEPNQTIAEIDLKALASGVSLLPGDRVILAKPEAN
jgi:hypothetical protein